MPGMNAIKYRKLCQFILSLGYELVRSSGSHERYYLPSHRGGDGNLTIAMGHGGDIPEGTLHHIIKDISIQAGLSMAQVKSCLAAIDSSCAAATL